MPALLSPREIDEHLVDVPGWEHDGREITRTHTLPGFPDALVFACAVGRLAELADHHPDILIQYRDVTLTLSTHSAGGITSLDFELARAINAIVAVET